MMGPRWKATTDTYIEPRPWPGKGQAQHAGSASPKCDQIIRKWLSHKSTSLCPSLAVATAATVEMPFCCSIPFIRSITWRLRRSENHWSTEKETITSANEAISKSRARKLSENFTFIKHAMEMETAARMGKEGIGLDGRPMPMASTCTKPCPITKDGMRPVENETSRWSWRTSEKGDQGLDNGQHHCDNPKKGMHWLGRQIIVDWIAQTRAKPSAVQIGENANESDQDKHKSEAIGHTMDLPMGKSI